jgi:hypothetical protein
VFWVDERVVPKDHADSNYKLASDEFLSKVLRCLVKSNCFGCESWRRVSVDLILCRNGFMICLESWRMEMWNYFW